MHSQQHIIEIEPYAALCVHGPVCTNCTCLEPYYGISRRCAEVAAGVYVSCAWSGMMNAISGDKAPDKSQGELTGLLKAMGYAQDQVYKF